MPTPYDATEQHVGFDVGINAFWNFLLRDTEADKLTQARFNAVVQLIDACLQAFMFVDERFANQHARHAGVSLREAK
jgi:hypothetical protein